MPKVSVIMSVYNGEDFLKEAIESIAYQSFCDYEFIITDDCSLDNSLNIIKGYAKSDDRIVVVCNKTNKGLTRSLNYMIDIAQGDFIARMDADDISEVDRLEKQVKTLDSSLNVDFVFSNTVLIDDNNNVICNSWRPKNIKIILQLLSYVNYIPHPTVMVKSEIFKKNKYNNDFLTGQDKELWLRLVNKGFRFYFMNEALLKYRINFNSVRNKHDDKYQKYVSTCFYNDSKHKAFKYFKYLNAYYKFLFLIKYLIPFKVVFYKGLLFRKFFGVD